MAYPLGHRLIAVRITRVRHFLHDEKFHLLLEIERTAELERSSAGRTNSLSKILEIGAANRQRRAGHDGGARISKQHSFQHRSDIDWGGVERKISGRFSSLLDPINVAIGALLEKRGDADPGLAYAS